MNKGISVDRGDMTLLLSILDLQIPYVIILTDIIVSISPFYEGKIFPKCQISVHFYIVLQLLQDDKAQKTEIMDQNLTKIIFKANSHYTSVKLPCPFCV